jgi:hypothetical protein
MQQQASASFRWSAKVNYRLYTSLRERLPLSIARQSLRIYLLVSLERLSIITYLPTWTKSVTGHVHKLYVCIASYTGSMEWKNRISCVRCCCECWYRGNTDKLMCNTKHISFMQ